VQRITLSKRVAAAAVAGGMILAVAGAAYAYFTANGSGGGSINTAAPAAVTLTSVDPVTGLVPGTTKAVHGVVNNPNSYSIKLGVASSLSVATANANSVCAHDYAADTQNASPVTLNPGNNDIVVGEVTMIDNGDQTSCEGEQLNMSAVWTAS